jgi:hypothetical protein
MSIGVLDVIERLPEELAARLEADEYFVDIPVVVAEEGDIQATIAKKTAIVQGKSGRRGVVVIVLPLVADDEYPNVAFGSMTLRPAFQVVENVSMNNDPAGTGKSARQVARRIRDVIKPLALLGLCTEMVPDKPCIEPLNLEGEIGRSTRAYQVNFMTYEADSEEVNQVAMPQPESGGGDTPSFAIACDTAGAEIYYTTDDSFPAAGRAGSSLYAAPVAIPAEGLTVRIAGYKSGWIASQVWRGRVEYTV